MTNINRDLFIAGLNYYIDHIQIELRHNRADMLRPLVDPLCALASGFIVKCQGTPRYEGNHSKFKTHMFSAVASQTDEKTRMEHAVPLLVIEKCLLNERKSYDEPIQRKKLLGLIQHLVLPCVVNDEQNNKLNTEHQRTMPTGWNDALDWVEWNVWARYVKAGIPHELVQRTDKMEARAAEAKCIVESLNDDLTATAATGEFNHPSGQEQHKSVSNKGQKLCEFCKIRTATEQVGRWDTWLRTKRSIPACSVCAPNHQQT
jgi:hypothetical protein